LNALSLVQRVSRRLPGYDPVLEVLDEVNVAYKETWDYILQLEDSYFTDIKTVTVNAQASEFDLLYNSNANLAGPVSNRYFQVDLIRVLQPNDVNWIPAKPVPWNDPQMLAIRQQIPQIAATFPPYLYTLFAKGSILFGRPLPVGTKLEVTYTFFWLPLTIVSNGTITSSGTAITGTNTSFTQLLPADFQAGFPGNDQDTDVGIELVLPGNQTYRLKTLTSDTVAATVNAVSPALASASGYQMAMVPDIPDGHHNVISTIATRNMMSTPGNDPRFAQWASMAKVELDAMRDTIMTRQRQAPAQRKRFPFGLLNRWVQPATR